MKFGGIYHEVKKTGDRFELSFEKQWYQVWKRSNDTFPADEPIYCFTAVFAPVDLNTTIYHHWYFRTNDSKPFTHADRIPLTNYLKILAYISIQSAECVARRYRR